MNNNSLKQWWLTRIRFRLEGKFENGVDIEEVLNKLHYYETTLHRLAETACNRDLTAHEEKREASITSKVHTLANQMGFKVKIQHDPRGGRADGGGG